MPSAKVGAHIKGPKSSKKYPPQPIFILLKNRFNSKPFKALFAVEIYIHPKWWILGFRQSSNIRLLISFSLLRISHQEAG
jgi:hypothetical protein